jgi:phytoene dehydrogenase-like protein
MTREEKMNYDAIVVGGGIAGLTASAYLAKSGLTTLLCEKESTLGGLVNSFERNGFVFDGGIRAMENSGILFPMLKHLGVEIEFVKNHISLGIEDRVIQIQSEASILEYQDLLTRFYPESKVEIEEIILQIQKIAHYMTVQYGIDNPMFLDFKKDQAYLVKVILPWVVQYALTVRKITALNEPVADYLKRFTQDQSLLDMITQHFFRNTPAFFALSYLKLYVDYSYPLGGTGKFVEKMTDFITAHHGVLNRATEITAVDPDRRLVKDSKGRTFGYGRLIWAADQNLLYRMIDPQQIPDDKARIGVIRRRELLAGKSGNDSILTVFYALDLDPSYFVGKSSAHFFYTPSRLGQSAAGPIPYNGDREIIQRWLEQFFALTTYEISCPVMRDPTLAPPGKTGLIVSVLFDYKLTLLIEQMGWYEPFKIFAETCITRILNASIYPGFQEAILERFSSTPLTIAKVTGNTEGAITGWSFTNDPIPAESRLPKVLSSIQTPIPGIFQAGQWTYSPSGLPISILSGKIAADRVIKELRKK